MKNRSDKNNFAEDLLTQEVPPAGHSERSKLICFLLQVLGDFLRPVFRGVKSEINFLDHVDPVLPDPPP